MNISNDESEILKAKVPRPWPMTVLCFFGFLFSLQLGLLICVTYFISRGMTSAGRFAMLEFIFSLLLISSALVFYWKMKRYGLYLFIILLVYSLIKEFFLNAHFETQHYLGLLVFIGTGLFYYKRLR